MMRKSLVRAGYGSYAWLTLLVVIIPTCALLAVTPGGSIPEIPSEKTGLKAMLDDLPKLVTKFSAIEDQVKKVVTSVGGLTDKVKANPSLLLRRPEKESSEAARR